jgi:hypothetical protein
MYSFWKVFEEIFNFFKKFWQFFESFLQVFERTRVITEQLQRRICGIYITDSLFEGVTAVESSSHLPEFRNHLAESSSM